MTNSLEATTPEVAAEWHPTKNGALTAADVVAGSNKVFWWRCGQNPQHEWEAMAANRTRDGMGSGCPHCAPPKDSWQQVCLAFEIAAFFEVDVDDHLVRVPGRKRVWNVDIVLRGERIAVEFDGLYWHNTPEAHERDSQKLESLESDGWRVIRVREYPLKPIGPHDVVVSYKSAKQAAILTLRRLQEMVGYSIPGLLDYMSTAEPIRLEDAIAHMQRLKNSRSQFQAVGS